MDDALLVNRALAGDLDSFGQLYDRYFTRIYDFAWRILRDADEAADVTQDVFMKAMQGLGGLGKASSFKSWLFSIAHNTAVTRAERAGRMVPLPAPAHEEAFGTFDVPDPCRLDNPEIAAGDHELAALVWEAATALNPRDYALLDLHVRQGLESAEIAGVMGVSKGNAYTMVSRMKTAAAGVIGSYIVARRGSQDCEGLQAVLAEHEFPPYTEPVRKAVDAHIKDCEICSGARNRLIAPLEIFGAFAAIPAPMALKGNIWGNVAGGWHTNGPGGTGGSGGAPADAREPLPQNPYGRGGAYAAGEGAIGAGAGAASAFGFGGGDGDGGGFDSAVSPMSYDGGDEGWTRNKILLFAGAALGILIFAFGGGALIAGGFGGGGGGGGGSAGTRTATATRTGTPQTTITVGVSVPTPTPAPPTPTPGPATPTEVPPTQTPPPAPTDTPLPAATATRTPPRGRTATPTTEPTATRTPRGTPVFPTATATPCKPGPACPPQ